MRAALSLVVEAAREDSRGGLIANTAVEPAGDAPIARLVRQAFDRQESARWPRLRRRGVIINVSSIGARAAYRPTDYGTAKAALTNLSKALAEEFGDQGVRVLTVSPGPTRTRNRADPAGYAGRLAAAEGMSLTEFPARMGITTGRLTGPEETAARVTFLASPRAANLTGADYLADGGALKAV